VVGVVGAVGGGSVGVVGVVGSVGVVAVEVVVVAVVVVVMVGVVVVVGVPVHVRATSVSSVDAPSWRFSISCLSTVAGGSALTRSAKLCAATAAWPEFPSAQAD
jgi:hypothetical protein